MYKNSKKYLPQKQQNYNTYVYSNGFKKHIHMISQIKIFDLFVVIQVYYFNITNGSLSEYNLKWQIPF